MVWPLKRGHVWTVLGLIVVALAATTVTGKWTRSEAAPVAVPQRAGARTVVVHDVSAAPSHRVHTYFGVLRAADQLVLSFAQGGRLASRSVSIGERVRAGQPVATLETEQLDHGVAAAQATLEGLEAQLQQLQRDRARLERLVETAAAPTQQLEQLEASEQALRATHGAALVQLHEAERARREATLRAPFAGVVREVLVEPGEVVGPGMPVVLLVGEGALEVEVEVSEAVVGRLDTGCPVEVDLPLSGIEGLQGELLSVGRSTGAPGRLFPALIALPPTVAALPGMAAEVRLAIPAEPALTVPVASVVDPTGGLPSVFVVRDGCAQRIDVDVVELVGEQVAIRGELVEGELVVTGGLVGLVDGQDVEVLR